MVFADDTTLVVERQTPDDAVAKLNITKVTLVSRLYERCQCVNMYKMMATFLYRCRLDIKTVVKDEQHDFYSSKTALW